MLSTVGNSKDGLHKECNGYNNYYYNKGVIMIKKYNNKEINENLYIGV